jgi:hypothetical protein
MSAADPMAVVLARHLPYDCDQPDHPDKEHFILWKGHASPLLCAAFKAVGHQPPACGEHWTVCSHRVWCFTCNEWCYPVFEIECIRCGSPEG